MGFATVREKQRTHLQKPAAAVVVVVVVVVADLLALGKVRLVEFVALAVGCTRRQERERRTSEALLP